MNERLEGKDVYSYIGVGGLRVHRTVYGMICWCVF